MLLKMDSQVEASISAMTASTCSEECHIALLSKAGLFLPRARVGRRPPTRTIRKLVEVGLEDRDELKASNSGTDSSKVSSTRLSKRSQLSSRFCVYEKSARRFCATLRRLASFDFARHMHLSVQVPTGTVASPG